MFLLYQGGKSEGSEGRLAKFSVHTAIPMSF
jgi:hypothetical protein